MQTSTSSEANNSSSDLILSDKGGDSRFLMEPIHYIIIVLMFYMGGLTVLIIKYIQSENKEARYQQYYVDFVKRPTFNRPRLMQEIRKTSCDEDGQTVVGVTRLTANTSFYHKAKGILVKELDEPKNSRIDNEFTTELASSSRTYGFQMQQSVTTINEESSTKKP